MFSRFRLLAAGLAILTLGVVVGAACGDDDDSADAQDGVTQEQFDELALDAQQSGVLAAMTVYRVEELHAIDEDSQTASEFEAGWSGSITRMRQATQGTNWPEGLAAGAEDLESALIAAEEAIEAEDLAAFKTAAADSHSAWHDLEHDAYSFIAGEEHSEDDGHSDDDGHDDAEATDSADHDAEATDDGHDDSSSAGGMDDHAVIMLTDSDTIPEVDLVVEADAKAGWNVHIVTTNWAWAPEHASTAHVPGEGHAHIYVDGVKLGRVYGEWYHLAALDAGEHEVMVTLNANDHSDLSYNGATIADIEMVEAA